MFDKIINIFRKKDETIPRIEWTEAYKHSVKEKLAPYIKQGKDITHRQTMLLMETGEETSPEIIILQQSYMQELKGNDVFQEVLKEAWQKVYAQFACEEMQCELNNRWGKEDKRLLKKKARKINDLIDKGRAKEAADIFHNSTSDLTLCVLLKSILKREFDIVWFSDAEITLPNTNTHSQIIG